MSVVVWAVRRPIVMFAGRHYVNTGVTGLTKMLLIKFTPDLMPSGITGTEILDEEQGSRRLRFTKGLIFAQIILADEINRTPPKTQAALLEAMQEYDVTISGHMYGQDGTQGLLRGGVVAKPSCFSAGIRHQAWHGLDHGIILQMSSRRVPRWLTERISVSGLEKPTKIGCSRGSSVSGTIERGCDSCMDRVWQAVNAENTGPIIETA